MKAKSGNSKKKSPAPKPKPPKAAAKKEAARKAAPKISTPKKVKKPAAPKASPAGRSRRAEKPPRRFNKRELDAFRRLLVDKQREFTDAYRASKGDSRDHLDNGTKDYIDDAVSSYAKEFILSLSELDRKHLLLVNEALRRIDRGEYGRCLQCGQEIVLKRLEVAPWARHCVRCQELEERGLLPQYSYAGESEEFDDSGEAEEGSFEADAGEEEAHADDLEMDDAEE